MTFRGGGEEGGGEGWQRRGKSCSLGGDGKGGVGEGDGDKDGWMNVFVDIEAPSCWDGDKNRGGGVRLEYVIVASNARDVTVADRSKSISVCVDVDPDSSHQLAVKCAAASLGTV